MACKKGNETIVKYLIEHGADINIKNKNDETPLSFAGKSINNYLINYLSLHGAN